jgi:hypothetical protein
MKISGQMPTKLTITKEIATTLRDFRTDTRKRLELEGELRMNRNQQASSDFLKGSEPVTDDQAIEAGLTKAVRDTGAKLSQPITKYRSYFERQVDAALEQGREITKASLAGYENAGPRQKTNANLQPAGEGIEEMTNAVASATEGDVARCKRYCQQQGRTSCPNCHGEGFAAHEKRMGKSVHKARHFGRSDVELAPITMEK